MVLRMPRPYKDKTTGIYLFRQRVPVAIQPIVSKEWVKISLRTRDPAIAKIEHARIAAEVAERFARLAEGTRTLSHREVEGIAGEIYRSFIATYEDDPDKVPGRYGALLLDRAFVRPGSVRIYPMGDPAATKAALARRAVSRNAKRVDAWLETKGILLDTESRTKVGLAVDKAVLQAREQLHRMADGDYRDDPDASRFPKLDLDAKRREAAEAGKRGTLKVFDDYAKEREIADSTERRWRPIIEKVAHEVPDLGKMTPQWVVDWKDQLIRDGIARKTIRDTHLTALRTICKWAATNQRIPANPAAGISLLVKKKARLRERGYRDSEARKILLAALGPHPARLSPHYQRARRWVPWICAYSGARVGEIAQLRKTDIVPRGEIWMIHITPEAGTNKTNSARWVPVHAALIEQGFIDFVQAAREGPLFYNPQLAKGGKMPLADRVGGHLAAWIRQTVKITDPDIQPNHAWRHRMKTMSRDYDMRADATRYIQGHAPQAEDERYGDHNPKPLVREISKIPIFNLDADLHDEGASKDGDSAAIGITQTPW